MYTISSSDGTCLKFPDVKLKIEYEQEELMLKLKHYVKVRNKYGIYAGNQSKFVEHVDDLRPMDPRTMEALLAHYESELEIEIEPHRGRLKLNGKVR